MIMAIGMTVSKIDRGHMSEESGHNDYDWLKCNLRLHILLNLNVYTKWPALAEVCALRMLLVLNYLIYIVII